MHPSTSILLTQETMSAVLARVAYRLIQRRYNHHNHYDVDGAALCYRLQGDLQADGFRALSVWVAAYGYHLRTGRSTAATKQWIVARSRWAALNRSAGKPWARVPAK